MERKKTFRITRLAAVCAAAVLVLGLMSAVYAADVGGIQRTVQIWLHGDQTDAVLEIENGEYSLTYQDADGNVHERHGGGVAFGPGGRERPLTAEELLEEDINVPEVVEENGAVTVYYHGQTLDITDQFDEDGVCRVLLRDTEKTLYLTVKRGGGYAFGPHGYISPRSFN